MTPEPADDTELLFPLRSSDDVQDDDELSVLDFVFDERIRHTAQTLSSGRSHVVELRQQVEAVLSGQGDVTALFEATERLTRRIDAAVLHFQTHQQRSPQHAEYCTQNVEAYTRARNALEYMHRYVTESPRTEYLTAGMSSFEMAVMDVDQLAEAK